MFLSTMVSTLDPGPGGDRCYHRCYGGEKTLASTIFVHLFILLICLFIKHIGQCVQSSKTIMNMLQLT